MKKEELLINSYIQAYNDMDVVGMLELMHENIVFENYSKGQLMLRIEGIKAFQIQAERACTFFSWRKQVITDLKYVDNEILIDIDYQAILALDLSSDLKTGDELNLKGSSTFRFRNGLIIYLKDES